MRYGTLLLSLMHNGAAGLLCFRHPQSFFGPLARNGFGKLLQHPLVDLRPELQQWHRSIETHIQSCVVRVVKTLEKCKCGWNFSVRSHRPAPERTTIGQSVEFIEEHAPVPEWLSLVVDVRSLPGVQCGAPRPGVQKAIACDLPGVIARRSVKIRVVPIPLCALPEFHHWEIPGDHHGNRFLFSRLQRETHSDGPSQCFAGAHP